MKNRLASIAGRSTIFYVLMLFLFLLAISGLVLAWQMPPQARLPLLGVILLINIGLLLLVTLFFHRFQKQSAAQEASFRAIFENSSDAIGVSIHGMLTGLLNPAFLRLFGYQSADELAGHSLLELVDPFHREAVATILRQWSAGLPPAAHIVSRGMRKDQTTFDIEIDVSIYRLNDPDHIMLLVHDLTERLRVEAEIKRLNQELELRVTERTAQLETTIHNLDATIQDLNSFTYSISHDLRAPLRSIGAFSNMLIEDLRDRLSPDELEDLRTIQAGAERMTQMVDALLGFARLGRQAMQCVPIDTEDLVRDVLSDFRAEIQSRPVEIEIGKLLPCTGDLFLLRHVWMNLISNALKFTRQCSPAHVTIGCKPGSEGYPVYFVRDNGVGFDMRYANRLFGVFQRMHSADEFEGNGVGLAIADRIIKRHGGRIWAESQVGEGTTFYFTV